MKIKGEVHILVNFPIDTSLKRKVHSAMVTLVIHLIGSFFEVASLKSSVEPRLSSLLHPDLF